MRLSSRFVIGLVLVATCLGFQSIPRAGASSWWSPPLGNQPWQWELSHPLRLTNARDMGTNDKLPNAKHAPNPVIFDIDGDHQPEVDGDGIARTGQARRLLRRGGRRRKLLLGRPRGDPTSYYQQLHAAGVFGNEGSRLPRVLPEHPVSGHGLDHRIDDRQTSARPRDSMPWRPTSTRSTPTPAGSR